MQLAISTATAACSVALLDGQTIVDERHEVVGRGHAERLVPMIASLPGNGRAASILVDCGPGSFTGVRVGVAAARALALAWQVPLHGVSTLSLIAAGLDPDVAEDNIAVAIGGGHGEFFIQQFSRHPLAPTTDLSSLKPEQAAIAVTANLILGSSAPALVELRGSGRAIDALPRAADARLLPQSLRQLPPTPIYGREPDAKPPSKPCTSRPA